MTIPELLRLSQNLAAGVDVLSFSAPVTHVYNPLIYARKPHETFLQTYGSGRKRVLFMGMNPGPWGMAQTGVPFGEIDHVRDWLGIYDLVGKPRFEHPKRPIEGFACSRSEVSGRRLWGLFAELFGTADVFFRDHFVLNYCPLVFMTESGKNLTPDKLPSAEAAPLNRCCNEHLRNVIDLLDPELLVGVGKYAESCFRGVLTEGESRRVGTILHPSPASPAANRDFAGTAQRQLKELGVI